MHTQTHDERANNERTWSRTRAILKYTPRQSNSTHSSSSCRRLMFRTVCEFRFLIVVAAAAFPPRCVYYCWQIVHVIFTVRLYDGQN